MIDYDEHIDDELKQMNEDEPSPTKGETQAFHLDDPISTVKLKTPITTTGETSVADCLELMHMKRIGCLLVVENDKLVGIFTDGDLRRKLKSHPQILKRR